MIPKIARYIPVEEFIGHGSIRKYYVLKRANINLVGDLLDFLSKKGTLTAIRGCGPYIEEDIFQTLVVIFKNNGYDIELKDILQERGGGK